MTPYVIDANYDILQLQDIALAELIDSEGMNIQVRDAGAAVSGKCLGYLSNAISCVAESEVNGGYELELQCAAGDSTDILRNRNIIIAPRYPGDDPQPFRIYRIEKPISGVLTVYARHIAQTDLAGIPTAPATGVYAHVPIDAVNNAAMIPTGFTMTSTVVGIYGYSSTTVRSVLAALLDGEDSIIGKYGGVLVYDGKTVTHKERMGENRGFSIRYGVNMTSVEQDENITNAYTGAVGYWDDGQGAIVYTKVVQNGAYDHCKIATIDLTDRFQEKPDKSRLEGALADYMAKNGVGVPMVSINVSYVAVPEDAKLGDIVTVKFEKLGIDVTTSINRTRYDVLRERYIDIIVGDAPKLLPETIANRDKAIRLIGKTFLGIANANITRAEENIKGWVETR